MIVSGVVQISGSQLDGSSFFDRKPSNYGFHRSCLMKCNMMHACKNFLIIIFMISWES